MTFIETIASYLSLIKIPVGRLSPYNLITDVSPSFIKADELRIHGIEIDGQKMFTKEFKVAAENYIGFDLVTEVLETEVRDGIHVRDHAIMLIQNSIEKASDYPDHYNRVIREIKSDIMQAQSRFNS